MCKQKKNDNKVAHQLNGVIYYNGSNSGLYILTETSERLVPPIKQPVILVLNVFGEGFLTVP